VGLALLSTALVACSATGSSTNAPGMMAGSSANNPGAMMGGSGSMMGDGTYHYAPLTCPAPAGLPGTTVAVMVGDMGVTKMMSGTAPTGARMMLRTSLLSAPAGQVSFVVSNMGWRTHEMVIVPLADGQQAGARVPGSDGKVDETGSLGEASNPCGSGAGDGITSGSVGWVTASLPAGHYELFCNEPNHYADGMWQEFDVT
jgi:uncharacterized cupredoxin-like copper-binding protein